MKAKIDIHGELSILRFDKYKAVYCPFTRATELCGDWCPLFSEPIYQQKKRDLDDYTIITRGIVLELCKKSLWFENLVDERHTTQKPDENQTPSGKEF